MDATVYIVTPLVTLLLSYVVIRFAVKHGTRSALEEHEVWKVDGGLDEAVKNRQKAIAFRTGTSDNPQQ